MENLPGGVLLLVVLIVMLAAVLAVLVSRRSPSVPKEELRTAIREQTERVTGPMHLLSEQLEQHQQATEHLIKSLEQQFTAKIEDLELAFAKATAAAEKEREVRQVQVPQMTPLRTERTTPPKNSRKSPGNTEQPGNP